MEFLACPWARLSRHSSTSSLRSTSWGSDTSIYCDTYRPWTRNGKKRSIQHDVVEAYPHLVKNPKLFAGGGYTGKEAAIAVQSQLCVYNHSDILKGTCGDGKIDGAFFGMGWITHPDAAKRFEHGKPLDNQPEFIHLYGKDGGTVEEQKKGYVDYPAAQY